ncbi:MAG: ABC transporter ATP-binding protein [Candidatus Margulisbacteria bacterium]|nr:ABC transporter ATP-binding protein [Candidatus Margulisiibacteriota bacterium]
MLETKDLVVSIAGKTILKGINLTIPAGETHVMFGPNGCGKSSLMMAILGYPQYKVESGQIFFKGQDITTLPINERASAGIGVMFQHPPAIKGVNLKSFLKKINEDNYSIHKGYIETLKLEALVSRDINDGFSGGERKRSELLQLMIQLPDFIMLDEPESGVDIENMKIVGQVARSLIKEGHLKKRIRSSLIITHTGYILDYLSADKGYMMMDGKIVCMGNPNDMFKTIQEHGFKACADCKI